MGDHRRVATIARTVLTIKLWIVVLAMQGIRSLLWLLVWVQESRVNAAWSEGLQLSVIIVGIVILRNHIKVVKELTRE